MDKCKVIEMARKAGFKVESFTGGKNVGKESVFDFGDVDILPPPPHDVRITSCRE